METHTNETLIRIDTRLDNFNQRFDKLDNRIWSNFYWAIGGFATTFGMLAKLLHWI